MDWISAGAGEHPPGSKCREPTGTRSRRRVVAAILPEWLQHGFPRKMFFAVLETLEDTHTLLPQTFFGNHFFRKHCDASPEYESNFYFPLRENRGYIKEIVFQ